MDALALKILSKQSLAETIGLRGQTPCRMFGAGKARLPCYNFFYIYRETHQLPGMQKLFFLTSHAVRPNLLNSFAQPDKLSTEERLSDQQPPEVPGVQQFPLQKGHGSPVHPNIQSTASKHQIWTLVPHTQARQLSTFQMSIYYTLSLLQKLTSPVFVIGQDAGNYSCKSSQRQVHQDTHIGKEVHRGRD
jgi:hypothetical protein